MTFKQLCEQLEHKIKNAYEEGITMEQAERLASEFLYAQIQVAKELETIDLDARMKKTGVKAIRAAVYIDASKTPEKKPTEAMLSSLVESNTMVTAEQEKLDIAEVTRSALERHFDIFTNSHVHFRNVAKGRFE